MPELLFEIGCEEMPARFVPPAIEQMVSLARAELAGQGLGFAEIKAHGTPRRLALVVTGLDQGQADREEVALGPPVKAAYDAEGQPTKAALGFARGQGVAVEALETIDTDKGPRVGVRKQISGRPAGEVLAELLPRLVTKLPFPKSMRWGSGSFRFARPIHWFVALLDGQVIPFELAGIKSGDQTRGHRFMAPGWIKLSGPADYLERLGQASVMADRDQRRRATAEQVAKAAAASGGRLVPDEPLIDEVTDLVELPVACLGSFDREFLEVPRAVIISAMREHQRYFALEDDQGNLRPNFIAVNNTQPRDLAVVTQGHERVLRARLADARFFLTEDSKTPLIDFLEDLKEVTFHSRLGTSFEKVQLVKDLALFIAERLGHLDQAQVARAAELAKCDLVTEMVGEFPSLQGVVGRDYALRSGEDPAVAEAIAEHYRPTAAGGELPSGDLGAVVGLADRLDSICGFLGVGMAPTGAADPYGLRRAAIAVIRIITEKGYNLSLDELIDRAVAGRQPWIEAAAQKGRKPSPADLEQVARQAHRFFQNRFQGLLTEQGVPTDVAQAVLEAGFDDLVAAKARALALAEVKDSPDFAPLAAGMKRVMNILRKEASQVPADPPRPELLQSGAEAELYQAFQDLAGEAERRIAEGDYLGFLRGMSGLKGPIDKFFDDVMVMVDDDQLRNNRLALLNHIAGLFASVAQFTHLQLV